MSQAEDTLKKLMPFLKMAAPMLQKRVAGRAAAALNNRRQKRLLPAAEPVRPLANETALPAVSTLKAQPARSPLPVVAGMVIGAVSGVVAGIVLFGRRGRQ